MELTNDTFNRHPPTSDRLHRKEIAWRNSQYVIQWHYMLVMVATIVKISLSLTPEQERFVREQVDRGLYINADQVISEALALLEGVHKQKVETLKEQIAIGTEHIKNGQVTNGEVVSDRLS